MIYMVIASAWNWATETSFWTPLEMAISAVLTVAFFGGICWVIVNVLMRLFYGRNIQFQSYLRRGGDPYIDSLPYPFNPDSDIVRQTGMAEPNTAFKPPANWKFQCPQCGARVQHQIDICWNCGYGADGDSSAYLRRYGNVKPPGISDAQWEAIQRGEAVNGVGSGCSGGSCSPPPPSDDGYDGWLPVDERPRPG